jgi:hypothetical protein
MAINARLEQNRGIDRRTSPRRKISLDMTLESGRPLTIHDLSSTGMLVETSAQLPLFEPVQIDLPQAGSKHAIVVWTSGRYYGCEFQEPLSKAAISAALLRSQPQRAEKVPGRASSDVPRPDRSSASPLEHHEASEPEEEKAPLGVRLRVILGSALILWALIISAVWSLLKLIR